MVTKATKKKGSRVKVGKLKLGKETVKDLTKSEGKKIKGASAWICRTLPPSHGC